MQAFFLYVLALGAGVSVATQQVLNGNLRSSLGSPAWAALFSYVGGLLTMIVVVIALGEHLPPWKAMANAPWWAWSGGVFGGIFILLAILLLPPLGSATLIALIVAGILALFRVLKWRNQGGPVARLAPRAAGIAVACILAGGGLFALGMTLDLIR